MKSTVIKELSEGDNTFYQFDKDVGFWGIPSISHNIRYPVAPDKVFEAAHNSYGNRDDEILDIISPTGPNVEHKGPLIYAHGGGWVCVNRELLMQSITPFIRAG